MRNPSRTSLELVIDGRWLSMDCLYGDVVPSWVWPGGSDTLTFQPATVPRNRFSGGELVTAMYGPVPVWAGSLAEPDPSQPMSAVGAWQEATCQALDGSGNATTVPDTAIDAAIGRGAVSWSRVNSLSTTAVDLDVSQGPVTLGALLDEYALANGLRWGVDARRVVYAKVDDTIPSWQTWPLESGLGYDTTNYFSTLLGRYYNGTNYRTAIVTGDTVHGYREAPPLDLTGRGTLTSAKASNLLTNMLKLGVATPAFSQSIGFSYGELLSPGGVPVDLEVAGAAIDGALLRVHGGWDLVQRKNAQLYLDVLLGRASLQDGVLTVQAMQSSTKNLADFVAKASTRKVLQ